MHNALFLAAGGVKGGGADLTFPDAPELPSIDCKSYDCSPSKRYFAINAAKHEDLRDVRPIYFCMIAPPLAQVAHVALVPHEAVSAWQIRTLGNRVPPDPARVLPIGAFVKTFCSAVKYTVDHLQAQATAGEARVIEAAPAMTAALSDELRGASWALLSSELLQ